MSNILFIILDTVYDFLHIFLIFCIAEQTHILHFFCNMKDYFYCKQEFTAICLNCLIIETLVHFFILFKYAVIFINFATFGDLF